MINLIIIGTNLAFVSQFEAIFPPPPDPNEPQPPDITFGIWFAFAAPFVILCLFCLWGWLILVYMRSVEGIEVSIDALHIKLNALGRTKVEEWIIMGTIVSLIVLWLSRSDGWGDFVEDVEDSTVAVLGAMFLFACPTFPIKKGAITVSWSKRLLLWEDCKNLSWGICLLLGAGYTLAEAFQGIYYHKLLQKPSVDFSILTYVISPSDWIVEYFGRCAL